MSDVRITIENHGVSLVVHVDREMLDDAERLGQFLVYGWRESTALAPATIAEDRFTERQP